MSDSTQDYEEFKLSKVSEALNGVRIVYAKEVESESVDGCEYTFSTQVWPKLLLLDGSNYKLLATIMIDEDEETVVEAGIYLPDNKAAKTPFELAEKPPNGILN